ncbi:UXX-star selenoprotein family 1 [Salidesulfovibrio brasiliensis]|uniref:UXX-star selenoprotein family 1 n=1 Tax=Salidesulfovibrio brasiliensis TaxID=221711 RepID=UPI0006D0FCC2|nr:UXX-star (seleno)protein family 1 [Salidesulfovibrio brasiliensis]
MSDTITIYGKSTCPHTKRALDAHPEAAFVDVLLDPAKLDEMLELNGGQRRVPTIVRNGEVEVGFNRGS